MLAAIKILTVTSAKASLHSSRNDFGGGYSNSFTPYDSFRSAEFHASAHRPFFRSLPTASATRSTPPTFSNAFLSRSVTQCSNSAALTPTPITIRAFASPLRVSPPRVARIARNGINQINRPRRVRLASRRRRLSRDVDVRRKRTPSSAVSARDARSTLERPRADVCGRDDSRRRRPSVVVRKKKGGTR